MKKYKQFINENNLNIVSEYIEEFEKIKSTINSCNTEEQIRSADKLFVLWKNKWSKFMSQIHNYDFNNDIIELNNLIKNKFKTFI